MTKTSTKEMQQFFTAPKKESLMDKTTRVAQELVDHETAQRQAKIARLRQARLDQEAATSGKPVTTSSDKSGN